MEAGNTRWTNYGIEETKYFRRTNKKGNDKMPTRNDKNDRSARADVMTSAGEKENEVSDKIEKEIKTPF